MSVPSEGGFLVEPTFSRDLINSVFETGLLAKRCKRIPIGANSNNLTINGIDETSRVSTRYGGIVSYWTAEAGKRLPQTQIQTDFSEFE